MSTGDPKLKHVWDDVERPGPAPPHPGDDPGDGPSLQEWARAARAYDDWARANRKYVLAEACRAIHESGNRNRTPVERAVLAMGAMMLAGDLGGGLDLFSTLLRRVG